MQDGREGGWMTYDRHNGEDACENDTYVFKFYDVPELPFAIALFNRRSGGRAIGMKRLTSEKPWHGNYRRDIAVRWYVHIPTVETPEEERVSCL